MAIRIRANGLACKMLSLVPLRVSPYLLLPARIGLDCSTWVEVKWRISGNGYS